MAKSNRSTLIVFVLLGLAGAALFFKKDIAELYIRVQSDKHFVKIGDNYIRVELAVEPHEWERGLMFRERLGDNEGMLFVGKREEVRSFWMKNTPISLDILYIGADLEIKRIAERTTPFSEESIPSGIPVQHVLEIRGGRTAEMKFTVGDKVEFLFSLPTKVD